MTRPRFLVLMTVISAVVGAACWIGGDWKAGLLGFLTVLVPQLIFAFVPWSGFEGLSPGVKDERQQNIGVEAMALAGAAAGLVALVGGLYRIANDQPLGEFGLICVVCGATFWVAMLVLPRVR
jgi:hypothetical protein